MSLSLIEARWLEDSQDRKKKFAFLQEWAASDALDAKLPKLARPKSGNSDPMFLDLHKSDQVNHKTGYAQIKTSLVALA